MLKQVQLKPDYLFEVSWEVCNKVGGIYTVIATKAHYIKHEFQDNYILIGPDFWRDSDLNKEFIEDKELFSDWNQHATNAGLKVRVGRWNIECKPIVILIDFGGAYNHKNEIFKNLWDNFQIQSINGGGDYQEPTLFGFYSGIVIESFCNYYNKTNAPVIAQFHEWLTGAGIFHLKQKSPQIATVFTTHATVLGRCVAGSGWPFYSRFYQHEPAYTANYFNVEAKYTLEKACAHHADCFTTVSEITAKECRHFLYKEPDVITNNGIDSKVIKKARFDQKRAAARKVMTDVACALSGQTIADDTLFILKSSRYEFKNKGIDVFIDALGRLNGKRELKKTIVAFILVPANNSGPRREVLDALNGNGKPGAATGISTHYLNNQWDDPIYQKLHKNGLINNRDNKVKVIFVPTFLGGGDGVFNMVYDDLLIGFDLTAFPSYYEPWGYTPLESLSSYIPSITTSISGLALAVKNLPYAVQNGISIIERNDFNQDEVIDTITMVIDEYAGKTAAEVDLSRSQARKLSQFFVWESQLHRYKEAYHKALKLK